VLFISLDSFRPWFGFILAFFILPSMLICFIPELNPVKFNLAVIGAFVCKILMSIITASVQ